MSPCCSPFMSNGTMTEGDRNEVLLLQLSDEFLLVVQLISQAADLLLMSLTVGVDLLLHGFLNTHKCTQSTYNSSDRIHHRNTVNQYKYTVSMMQKLTSS